MMEIQSLLRKSNWLLAGAVAVLIAILVLGGILFSCESTKPEETVEIDYTKEQLIARGQYLVNTSACHDCHSPKILTPNGPEPDPERLLSGYPAETPLPEIKVESLKNWVLFNQELTSAVGPWGVSFAANITSDETGIGNWTEGQFLTALKKGKYKGLEGSRALLPPMPWPIYRNMTDTDLRAIYYYLQTTKPIKNIVPAPIAPGDIK